MATEQNYQETVADYVGQLRGLFVVSDEDAARTATRAGATTISNEVLANRAEEFASTSQRLGQMTAGHLEDAERTVREAAELKLLAQATAELEVAQSLLEQAEEETLEPARRTATQATRATAIQRGLDDLVTVLETPLEAGIQPFLSIRTRRRSHPAQDLDAARAYLQKEVGKSLQRISREAVKVGGRAARDLVLLDAALLVQGAALVSKDAERLLDRAIAGLGGLAKRLALSAIRLLLQAYDWVLALLGKDTEERARVQVKDWLDQIKNEQAGGDEDNGLFLGLVNRIYRPEAIDGEITAWLAAAERSADELAATAERVEGLAERYRVKADQVERLLKVVALSKRVPIVHTPQGQLVTAALTLGLLGYILYTGYDHVDSGRLVFASRFGFPIPDHVDGIRETVQRALGVTDAAPEPKRTA